MEKMVFLMREYLMSLPYSVTAVSTDSSFI